MTTHLVTAVIVVDAALLALAILVVILRVWSRVTISCNFGLPDVLMIISLVLFTAHSIIGWTILPYGLGQHVWDVPEHLIPYTLKLTIALGAIFVIGIGLVKLSILLFYLKTFPIQIVQIILITLIVFTTAYTTACALALIFPCNPLARTWDPDITHGYCINDFAVYYSQGAFNLLVDLFIIFLPLPLIAKLRIPWREKAIVFVLVGVSVVAMGVGSSRFWAIHALHTDPDLTWETAMGLIFGEVELSVAIICGSVIVMRPFFRRYTPAIIKGSWRSNSSHLSSPSRLSFD